MTALIQYGGRSVRGSDLFGQNKTPLSLTRRFFKGLKVASLVFLITMEGHDFEIQTWAVC